MPPPVQPHACGDAAGCIDWIAPVGAPDCPASVGRAIAVTDGVVIVGSAGGGGFQDLVRVANGTIGPIPLQAEVAFLARLSRAGSLIGGNVYDPSPRLDSLVAVAELENDLVAVGYAGRDDTGVTQQLLAMRVGRTGDVVWSQTYGTPSVGDTALDVAVSPSGRVYLSGYLTQSLPGALGTPGGAFVAELDPSDGSMRWARTFGSGAAEQLEATDDALFIGLAFTSALDLGAAGSFTASSGPFVIAASPLDGAPRVALEVPHRDVELASLVLDGDGLLFAATAYGGTHVPQGALAYRSDATLSVATSVVNVPGSYLVAEGIARSLGGDVLLTGTINSGASAFGLLSGWVAGSDPWMALFDPFGRPRFAKYDGDGHGNEHMYLAGSEDARVYAYGDFSETFTFESHYITPRAGLGGEGYVLQVTIAP